VASGLAVGAAQLVVVVHLAVLAYIVLGGLLALRGLVWLWPSIAMTVYSAYVTLASYTCPLTRLEKWLLERGGRVPYEGSFISRYLHDVLYPAQYERAAWVIATSFTLVTYVLVLTRWRRRRRVLQADAGTR
jgi:ABC-type xylose transport system permease subunit